MLKAHCYDMITHCHTFQQGLHRRCQNEIKIITTFILLHLDQGWLDLSQ